MLRAGFADIECCTSRKLAFKLYKVCYDQININRVEIPEHTTVGTNRNRKMPNYLLFIDILGENH